MRQLLSRLSLCLMFALSANMANAQDINLLPQYGGVTKNAAQLSADQTFLAGIDQQFKGDRKKAAEFTANRGWQLLQQGNLNDAMRRFNQAWLIDANNGSAVWGMAAVVGSTKQIEHALPLFEQAQALLPKDIDFAVDYARTIGMAAAENHNAPMLAQALAKFAQLHQRAPEHTLNLQNWAIVLFYQGEFAQAWQKIKLAEATSQAKDLDPRFIKDLEKKMARP